MGRLSCLFLATFNLFVAYAGSECHATDQTFAGQIVEVRKLRSNGKFAEAVKELKALGEKPNLSKDKRASILLETGETYANWAQSLRGTKFKDARDISAGHALTQFLRDYPESPLLRRVYSLLGDVRLSQSETLRVASLSEKNLKRRESLLNRSRNQIRVARAMYMKANAEATVAYKAFPQFIPLTDKQQRNARRIAEFRVIQSQLRIARTILDEGRTYDVGSTVGTKLLDSAEKKYGEIYAKHRTQVVGLMAHLQQAKCLSEKRDFQAALKIYRVILQHPAKSQFIKAMKFKAMQGQLYCLNCSSEKKFDVVVSKAKDWLKTHQDQHRTEAGVAIRFQLALALEQKANTIGPNAAIARKEAREQAEMIRKIGGVYRPLADAMIKRLKTSPKP